MSEIPGSDQYTVGWICALEVELVAAQAMLDEEFSDLPYTHGDSNAYILGRIEQHYVVLASPPSGDIGTSTAATVAANLLRTFPKVRFGLMVGVGGGAPGTPDVDPQKDLHLGDIVVSNPEGEQSGVVQYDFVKTLQGGKVVHNGSLNKPPTALRTVVTKLRARARRKGYLIQNHIEKMLQDNPKMKSEFAAPSFERDQLFKMDYSHRDAEKDCTHCDTEYLVRRQRRAQNDPVVHYGLIGSADKVIEDAARREKLRQEQGLICFETGAAGLMNDFPCLVIRGICNYCDSHKNKQWGPYAAAVAAAYAKELLGVLAPHRVRGTPAAREMVKAVAEQTDRLCDTQVTVQKVHDTVNLDKLRIAEGAAFDSYSHELVARCHPGTRVELRCQIRDWVSDPSGQSIFWLKGAPGSGKSTFSRTAAQEFADSGHLGASFFFKSGEDDRGNASRLFTTIAVQLVHSIPGLGPRVIKVIEGEQNISSKTLYDQFKKLILQPLSEINGFAGVTKLIIIDALDECANEGHIKLILGLLAQVCRIRTVRIKVLVTGRAETALRLGFQPIHDSHQNYTLHEIPQPIIEHDLAVFLRSELAIIRDEYNCSFPSSHHLPEGWPGEEKIQTLVGLAVPLFIVAVDMCRFIQEKGWDWDPKGKLEKILLHRTLGACSRVKRIYPSLLEQLLTGDITEPEKDTRLWEFRIIVGSVIMLFEPLSVRALSNILGLPEAAVSGKLHALHSVLSIPDDADSPVRLLHLSFREYLVEPNGSHGPFRIDEKEAHRHIAFNCLNLLLETDHLHADIYGLGKPGHSRATIDSRVNPKFLPVDVQYACRYWVYHLQQGECLICDQDQAHSFLEQRFLYWLEALSLIGRVAESIDMLVTLQTLIKPSHSLRLDLFLADARRFVLMYSGVLDIAPLQMYASAAIFAPEKSVIRGMAQKHMPSWLERLPKVPGVWSSVLQALEGHSDTVKLVCFSPNGKHLASASDDATVKLWNSASGTLQQTLEGHTQGVNSVAYSPDGKFLLSASKHRTIKLWESASGILQQTLEDHTDRINALTFSRDGKRFASGSDDASVKVWTATSGSFSLSQTLQDHEAQILSIAFSADGKLLASACEDYTVKVWDSAADVIQLLQTLEGHSDSVWEVAFSHNGKELASESQDGTMKLWNAESGALKKTFDCQPGPVNTIAFSPSGAQLASGSNDGSVRIWNAASGSLENISTGHTGVTSMVFSPDGKQLALGSWDCTIQLCFVGLEDVSSLQAEEDEYHSRETSSVAFSPNGKLLASESADKTIKLWNPNVDLLHTLEGHSDGIIRLAFHPNGRQLASGSWDATIKVWDITSGALQTSLPQRSAPILGMIFSPDGKQLASGSSSPDERIVLWNTASDTTLDPPHYTLDNGSRSITSLQFSPDSKQLASGSVKDIRLWHAPSGTLQTILAGQSTYFGPLAFSPDGEQLASGADDKRVCLWQTATGDLVRTFEGHSEFIESVAFSLDGKQLATGSLDWTIKLWNVDTADLQQTIQLQNSVDRIAFQEHPPCLKTERGLLRIHQAQPATSSPHPQSSGTIFLDQDWISGDEGKLLWLPPEYRAVSSDFHDGNLAMGHASGRVTMLNFSLNRLG